MTERFKQIGICFIDKENPERSYCCANEIDCRNILRLLNTLHKENQDIKNTIQDMMETERTEIGKSTLKQLMERIK